MPKEKNKKEKGQLLWFRLVLFLVPRLVSTYFRLVDLTSRKIFLNREYEDQICRNKPFSCACFHGTMLFPVYYCRRYPGVIMVSRSWDGEIIDRSIRRMGYDTVRGSSSRGGKEALREMIDTIKERDYCSGLAVDAPRGPSRKVKMGIVVVAKETGHPVVPMVSWATRQIQFRSWDSMILPLPFSTVVMAFGKPTIVPQGLTNDDYENLRQEIESNMLAASEQVEEKVRNLKGKK
ncbi:MAG: lysophospholipid acyltransferase family protein [Desulfomonile tiedjei]|uniref:Lysophospholipid acyltransferase family protein n=1 Tax=Desulfomonile tiedjei TaxID=2358 RepID=A0A9D6Z2Y0_9BACT|nr:lysophospholipid acyltransferase family protein [Desulfomonile tiedjei]